MNLLDPSGMDAEEKDSLSKILTGSALIILLGASCAAMAGLVLYLLDSSLILTDPWAIIATAALIAALTGLMMVIQGRRGQ